MAGGGGGRVGKRKRPSVPFKPRGKKQVKDTEMFKRRKSARNNYVLPKVPVGQRANQN